jgi:hypothetical protein
MRNRLYLVLGVLLVASLGGLVCWAPWELREPVYQGKPLSSWLKASELAPFQRDALENANEAVRQAGTNALPTLLWMLRARDSALKVRLMDLARMVSIECTPAEDFNRATVDGFFVLGAKAQSAVPALIEIVNQNISAESRVCAIRALRVMGPPAKEAVPSLLRWATNGDSQVRSSAISALGGIHTEEAVHSLFRWVTNADADVRLVAIDTLVGIPAELDRVVPLLTNALHDPSSAVRQCATNVLKNIDPEAAVKAGVKVPSP